MQQSSDSNVEIGSRDLRRVYLITYSRADVNKFSAKTVFCRRCSGCLCRDKCHALVLLEGASSKVRCSLSHLSEVKQMSALVVCKEILSRPIWDICALH